MKHLEIVSRVVAKRGIIWFEAFLFVVLALVGGIASFLCLVAISDIKNWDVGDRLVAVFAVGWLVFWLALMWYMGNDLKRRL